MKNLLILILALAGIGQAQIVYDGGRSLVADTVRWGDSDDSSSSYNIRGNVVKRDSGTAGSVTMTTDSCSLPVTLSQGTIAPNTKLELSYEVRTSSGNTDSSQVKWRMDTRYCKGIGARLTCESWVPAGRFLGDTSSIVMDSLISVATASGTTWKPTRQLFDVPGGHQIRLCVDSHKAGGGTGDTTFFRRHVVRPSAIRAGGTPPSSATLTGDITVSDVTVSSSALPTGAATSAKQPALGTAGSSSTDVLSVQGIASGTALPVSIASVPSHAVTNAGTFAVQAAQSGTWTVQPGNTANTTAWKVDGSAVTQPVSDAGGSLTVDGTVSVTGVATAANQSTEITHLSTVAGAVKAEDAAHSSADPGIMPLAVRRDANTTLADASGDYAPLQVDASGSLKVAITAGAGSGGTSMADDAAFTPASTSVTPVAGTYIAAKDALNDGDAGAVAVTQYRAIHSYLVDANGDAVSVGGGTQYAEDAASADGHVGTVGLAVRKATPANTSGTDGDYEALQMSAGRLWVDASGKTLTVDGSGVTQPVSAASLPLPSGAATAAKQPALGTAGSASSDVITIQGIASGTVVPVSDGSGSLTVDYATTGSGTATGALRVELPTNGTGVIATVGAVTAITNALPAGTNAIGKLTANSGVDIGDVTVDGTVTANAGTGTFTVGGVAATDAAVSGNPVYTAGRASAAAPTDVSADGDVVPAWRLRNGAAASVLTAAGALIGGDATNGLDVDVTRLNDGGNSITVDNGGTFAVQAGQAAHDAAIAGNPVRAGLRAMTADMTAVASGDQVDALGTIDGKQVTKPHAIRAATWNYAAATGGITNTTAVTVKTAAGAGIRNCVTSLQVINAHATVSTEVLLVDGAAGTVLHRGWAQAAGGGFAANFDVPLCGTANTLLEVDNVTTGAAVLYNVQGYTTAE